MNAANAEHAASQGKRLWLAELGSSLGAGVLGIGLGVLGADLLRPIVAPLLTLGAAMHFSAMLERQRLRTLRGEQGTWWMSSVYWSCWAALLVLAGYLLFRRLW